MAIVSGDIAFEIKTSPPFALRGEIPADPLAAALSFHAVPVPINSRMESGGVVPMYFDADWGGRLHALPSTVDAGTVRTPQTEQVRLYNAGDAAENVTAVAAVNDGGIVVNHPVPPFSIAARDSELYDIDIVLGGPDSIDARYEFEATTTAVLLIIGERLGSQIWTLRPDWGDPVIERWQWTTDLQRAHGGQESRRQVYSTPRRAVLFRIVTDDIPVADRMLSGWQSRLFNVPRWQDRARLLADANAGETILLLDTTVGEWREGGQLVLLGDGDAEAPVIETVNAGDVVLANPLEKSWTAGTEVYPGRLMRLPQSVAFARRAAGILSGEAELLADVDTGTPYTPAEIGSETFDGLPVYLEEPNRVTDAPAGYSRDGERIDAPGGILLVDDPGGDPIHGHEWQVNKWTRSESDAFVRWLLARAGRANAFWFPTWSVDMEVVDAIEVDEDVLTILPIDWSTWYDDRDNRDVIALQEISGTWRFARVLSASIVDGDEILQLDRVLVTDPPAIQIADIRRVCWLELVRLDVDSVEVAWKTDSMVRVTLPLRGVKP